jgi:hypothetical protein
MRRVNSGRWRTPWTTAIVAVTVMVAPVLSASVAVWTLADPIAELENLADGEEETTGPDATDPCAGTMAARPLARVVDTLAVDATSHDHSAARLVGHPERGPPLRSGSAA